MIAATVTDAGAKPNCDVYKYQSQSPESWPLSLSPSPKLEEITASETHNVKKWNFRNKNEDHFIDLPRKKICNFTNKNMKEVKKSPKQLAAYINRIVGQTVKSSDKLCKVIYGRKFPGSGGCDMANKENELACAGHLPEKLHHDSQTYLVNSSDSGSSQTESLSLKHSRFFPEVSQFLFSRNLRLNVALTFWRKRSISGLADYLLRIEDLGVVVECLPVRTNSLQEEKQYISLCCYVDLLALVKSLLKIAFEEYVIVGLNWLQAVTKRWWSELSSKTEIINDGNTRILKQQLNGLWEQENYLTLVPGYTGNIAKDVDAYLFQLH
ncbi:KATNB1-like protein 1 [Cebus imitator]|uniref:KATNB1-like protein 1 n=1 Tax=Cebus imitator TaxID=2715852 RepID=UPI001898C340|nr:KATNB1-like protein 1 [Cebus imitator]